MAATPTPFAFSASLQIPPDPALPQDLVPFNFSGQFVALSEVVLNLTGATTTSIPFGSITSPGAKGIFFRYDLQVGAAPVTITVNGGTQALEIAPGGLLVWINPQPTAGGTSLSVVNTAACQLRAWILG